jgi:hypothetical protein
MMEWLLIITIWFGEASTVYVLERPLFDTEAQCKAAAPYAMRGFMMAIASGQLGTPNGFVRGQAPRYDVTCEIKGSKDI